MTECFSRSPPQGLKGLEEQCTWIGGNILISFYLYLVLLLKDKSFRMGPELRSILTRCFHQVALLLVFV